jgi:fructose-1,6-bisphosphatase/sedoheptulose 1,7-bisphosphatase-like protein
LFNYFNSVSDFDLEEYKRRFKIDLKEDKSLNVKYVCYGSSVHITDSNYIFSLGGVSKGELLRGLRKESVKGGDRVC